MKIGFSISYREIQGGEPTSWKRMKKTMSYTEKHPFKSVFKVNCCRFPFRYSDKNQDRLRECSKKQSIYIGKLDA